jgi:hypothetical protein
MLGEPITQAPDDARLAVYVKRCFQIPRQRRGASTNELRRTGGARAFFSIRARVTTCRVSKEPCGRLTTASPRWWITVRTSVRRASTSITSGSAADMASRRGRSRWRSNKWTPSGRRADRLLRRKARRLPTYRAPDARAPHYLPEAAGKPRSTGTGEGGAQKPSAAARANSPVPIPLGVPRRLILGHASAREMRVSGHKLSFRGILRRTR